MKSNHHIGRQGEFLAAFILEKHGIECHHVDRDGADLWCKAPGSGALFTVQVKTCSAPRLSNARAKNPKYTYHTQTCLDFEVMCFVAMDKQLLLLVPRSEIIRKTTRFDVSEFTEEAQRRTIEEVLRTC